LKINRDFLIDTEILKIKINSNSLQDLEVFLEKLASKSYLLPFIIGCSLPFNQLDFIQDWFANKDLLPLLLKIQQSVQTTQSFGSSDLTGKMTKAVYENVCLNLSTLIKGARVYVDLYPNLNI